MSQILIIAPHLDDEALGCGGTIAKHIEQGDSVRVCVVAHRVYQHIYDSAKMEEELRHFRQAKQILAYHDATFLNLSDERLDACLQDIIIPLEKVFSVVSPEIVYLPFFGDNNQDHRAVFHAARVVLRPTAATRVRAVYMYETPSSTEQSMPLAEMAFIPNHYVNIEKHLNIKLAAVHCYETEKREYPHPRSEQALRALAQKRGTEIGFPAAEAFMMLRNKWD